METQKLTIGRLAKLSEVNVETIRFYERKGLIEQPKTLSGYREYPEREVLKIRFIKRAQSLGFSLKEIAQLIYLRGEEKTTCGDFNEFGEKKIEEIDQKIKDLKKMKKSIKGLMDCCHDLGINDEMPLTDCPLIECFETSQGTCRQGENREQ